MQNQELWSAELCTALERVLHTAALISSVLPEAMPKVCTHAFQHSAYACVLCSPLSKTASLNDSCRIAPQSGIACLNVLHLEVQQHA